MRILDKQGLVSILPRRGARVTDPSVDEVNHIFEIRAVLLGLACSSPSVAKPTDRGAAEQVKALRGAVSPPAIPTSTCCRFSS
ncbi:MAG: hypothetical protein R3E48_23355 [Burkholderiaceae bacterium]